MEHIKKDPQGLIRNDMMHLRTLFKKPEYTPKDKIENIMFKEGQQSVLRYIEDQMIGKRENGIP